MIIAATVAGRASWRNAAVIVAAIEAVAVAIWLLPASVHIVRWPAGGPVRLALLAPAWQLLALTAAGAVIGAGVVLVARRRLTAREVAGPAAIRLQRVSAQAAPFLLLWLWAVPFLPWLPDRLPLLLLLAGPIRWVLLGVAVVAAAATLVDGGRLTAMVNRLDGRRVLAISAALYIVLGLNSVRVLGLGGDEPHYLIITESLLRDGDLQIENNHRQRDYQSFYPRELRPDFMQRGQNGAIYSIHAPGLPALLLPVYAVAGHRGAVVMIGLLAALAALAIFITARALAGQAAAVLTWLAVCLTVPFMPYSWSIFPEMGGAFVVAWAVAWLWQPAAQPLRVWMARGGLLALLPWMHTKFAVFFAAFAAALTLRLLARRGRGVVQVAALMTPMAVSGVLWLYSFQAIYGTPNPEAPYGGYTDTYVLTRYIPHGLIGIFFDQKFGLLIFSPIYLLAIAGCWILIRRRETQLIGTTLLITVVLFVASTARLYMFWGGSSAPARFLVPILPCLAPMIAVAIARARTSATRALVGLWLAISVGVALAGVASPARLLLFSDPHGRSRLLEFIQAGSPLALVVPTFTEPDWTTELTPLALWLASAGLALLATAVAARLSPAAHAGRVAAIACGVFLIAGAGLAARPSAAVREATARRGALDVIWQADGTRLRTLDYQTLSRTPPERLRELSTVMFTRQGTAGEPRLSLEPVDLPAGAYEAVVWFESARPRTGEVTVSSSPRAIFSRLHGTLGNPSRMLFELPVAVRRISVDVPDAELAKTVTRVEIVPRAVPPPGERPSLRARAIESLPEREHSYIIYLNEESYPEGGVFWTRGTAAAQVLVSPAGASRVVLTLSTGPNAGQVAVTVAGESRTIEMHADRTTTVAFDLPAAVPLVPITLRSSVMFRPGEVDPRSGDMRGLGCHVRVVLE